MRASLSGVRLYGQVGVGGLLVGDLPDFFLYMYWRVMPFTVLANIHQCKVIGSSKTFV